MDINIESLKPFGFKEYKRNSTIIEYYGPDFRIEKCIGQNEVKVIFGMEDYDSTFFGFTTMKQIEALISALHP